MTPRTAARGIAVLLAAGLIAAFVLAQGRADNVLSCEIRSEDWGVADWAAVRLGQLSVTRAAREELHVRALSTSARSQAPDHFRGETPECDGNCFVVSAFDFGNANALGGRFNSFAAAPSTARVTLKSADDGRRALTVDFSKAATGACGAWIHLFDFTRPAASRVYLNATPFSVLTFWVRGRRGGERILLKAADAAWEIKEDALPLGEVATFLSGGRIETTWQRALVPLSALPAGLKANELAVLVFEAAGAGDGQIAVKDFAFCTKSEPLPGLSAPLSAAEVKPPPGKAIWVWNTAQILPDMAGQQALVDFCLRRGFTDVFLQLPNDAARLGPAGEVVLEPQRWAPFLARFGRAGLRAHALDGARHSALPENHARVLKTVDNVVRYNATAKPGAQFTGVHFDIEPYLLPGFQGPRRERILSDWLDLVSGIASRAKAAGMTVGVDIPFWYDSPNELDGELLLVDFNGQRKPASEHVLDLVDHVGVMDYRTVAYGADGLVGLAEGELRYAAAKGKRVFVGLETTDLPDEDLVEFGGPPRVGLPQRAPAGRSVVLEVKPSGATVWLAPPGAWNDLQAARLSTKAPLLWWPVSRVVAVPSTKLTFSRLGAEALHEAMRQAADELGHYRSFAGYAIHDYLGYRKLLASAPAANSPAP
jgi:hypothetical protein